MAAIEFDLPKLFEKAFGYKTQAFKPTFPADTGDNSKLRKSAGATGTSYYAPVKGNNDREYYLPATLSNSSITLELPHPVVSISCKKTIIETPLTERSGTVKEVINLQDYDIVIKGFAINESHEFPEDLVKQLRQVFEQNTPLTLRCALTDIFLIRPERNGSELVVIRELKFPPVTGVKNVKPYELHLVSDQPFNLVSIS